jgi:hypothetical protein
LVQHPALFHAYAVGAMSIALTKVIDQQSGLAKQFRLAQIEQHQFALTKLGTEIRKPSFYPHEGHIHTIMSLARHTHGLAEPDEPVEASFEPYPLSPLAWLQNLYPLTSLDLVPEHVRAMYDMVEMRCGLQNIGRPVRDILQL